MPLIGHAEVRYSCDDVGMSTSPDDDGRQVTAPVSPPSVRPHRTRTGAVAGSVAAVVLSIVLLSFSGDGGESTPSLWNWAALVAPGALLLTGLLLMVSRVWRRFGVGFVVAVLAVLGVETVVLMLILLASVG
jgi:hypothetical protein